VDDRRTNRTPTLARWVDEVASHTQPERVHWCNGSAEEFAALTAEMTAAGTLLALNPDTHPRCFLHRSDPNDVARVEHLTFICTRRAEDAGPNNYWREPGEMRAMMTALFAGCMRRRTLYVVPYCMGPEGSPYARYGVELTDSPYVVANMYLMTRVGDAARRRIEAGAAFVRGIHSTGTLDPKRRFIVHFPESREIMSFGSGYGGNALLGKKCHALRIASWQARDEGWLAEHMLLMGVESPDGEVHYIAGAFPSACGKTNLAMLVPPAAYRGWKIHTLGDDIVWLHPGDDGRLWAINPEAGFFGVAPGTGSRTNPNAVSMLHHDTIFTNTALTADGRPWWEGLDEGAPAYDWQGRPYSPGSGPAAHPNSRFTVSIKQCPSYDSRAEDPGGVPLSAILFGGRRAALAPLVLEAGDWTHGVLLGAGMASETTAAATGEVGVVRRDPMAMQPFCGYHFGDYWAHWLAVGERLSRPPGIYQVNWFRKDDNGRFLWPGFGENLRVLEWIIGRCRGSAAAQSTPVGHVPAAGALQTAGLDLPAGTIDRLLNIDPAAWQEEFAAIGRHLAQYGLRVPDALLDRLATLRQGLPAH